MPEIELPEKIQEFLKIQAEQQGQPFSEECRKRILANRKAGLADDPLKVRAAVLQDMVYKPDSSFTGQKIGGISFRT